MSDEMKEDGTDAMVDQFMQFLSQATEELGQKQEDLSAVFGFSTGRCARWHFDQRKALLEMFDKADNKLFEADVVDIGSYASNSESWKWAWANDSVLPALRQASARIRELSAVTGINLFEREEPILAEDESFAWDMVACAVKHLGALGVFRAPSESRPLATYLAVMTLRDLRDAHGRTLT